MIQGCRPNSAHRDAPCRFPRSRFVLKLSLEGTQVRGDVHEGRNLRVWHRNASSPSLGPAANEATFMAMAIEPLAHEGEEHAPGVPPRASGSAPAAMTEHA